MNIIKFRLVFSASVFLVYTGSAYALDCDCSKTVASCTASVKADAQWFYFHSSSNSCSDIRYHFKTSTSTNDFSNPQQMTITNGEAQQAWTGQGRVTAVTVDSCSVCASGPPKTSRQIPSGIQTCAMFKAEILQGLDEGSRNSPEAMAFIDQQVEKKRVAGDCR